MLDVGIYLLLAFFSCFSVLLMFCVFMIKLCCDAELMREGCHHVDDCVLIAETVELGSNAIESVS